MQKPRENYRGFTEEEEQLWRDTVKTGEDMRRVSAIQQERKRREAEEELKEQWPSTEAARLFTQLGETFTACRKLLEQNPAMEAAAKLADGERHDIYTMLRDNLEKANRAPRCEHQKSNGQLCRAPKVRGQKYCNMHLAMEAARPTKFSLPALEDANSIQVALTKTAQGLVDGTLEEKVATKLAYVLQVAMSNVGNMDFEPEEDAG